MKKYFATFVLLAFAAISVTVFCLVSFEPLDSLMKPPMSNGENLEIQHAFENHINQKYKLRVPIKGDYRSSFIFEDTDGDNIEEVFVFYSLEDSLDTIRLCFMKKLEDKWRVVSDLESPYSEIQKISFADINNDDVMEIIVGWAIYQNDLTRNLSVYSLNDESADIVSLFDCSYSEFEIIDIDNNGTDDIAVFHNKDLSEGLSMSYISYGRREVYLKGVINLDASVYSIRSIAFDFPYKNSSARIFIDGYKTDSGIVTECVYWDKTTSSLVKINSDEGNNILSSRMTNIPCSDINHDGLIEIPIEEPLENSSVIISGVSDSSLQNLILWVQLSDGSVKNITRQLVYNNNDFSITFSDEWFENITVKNDYTNNNIYFYSNNVADKKLLFELKYISNQEEEDKLSDRYKYLTDTDKGKIFYIIYNYDPALNINSTYISNVIV